MSDLEKEVLRQAMLLAANRGRLFAAKFLISVSQALINEERETAEGLQRYADSLALPISETQPATGVDQAPQLRLVADNTSEDTAQ